MQYVDDFALIHIFLIISYCRTAASEHGKRHAYSFARSEIRWQNCYSLFIDNIFNYLLELIHALVTVHIAVLLITISLMAKQNDSSKLSNNYLRSLTNNVVLPNAK